MPMTVEQMKEGLELADVYLAVERALNRANVSKESRVKLRMELPDRADEVNMPRPILINALQQLREVVGMKLDELEVVRPASQFTPPEQP